MTQPLTLEATPIPEGVTLRVLGGSPVACEATFSLAVEAGSNRSIHRGGVTLGAGQNVVVSTISVTSGPSGVWQAVLNVTPASGTPYELIERSH